MRIAIPLSGGQLSQHFGHSEQFLFVDADLEQKRVLGRNLETPPHHAQGVIPRWLLERGVNVVIASGIGEHARDLLAAGSVQVLTGVSAADPEGLVIDFMNARLQTGAYPCDHSGHHCSH
jgi:ATP-binding protein involved in chromosome partitioning